MSAREKHIPQLKNDRVFIIGGYSHVDPLEMKQHKSFFDAISLLLQYRYGLNPEYALRDNESKLEGLPYETQRKLTHQRDIDSTVHAGFVVALGDHASTGTGQEMRAAEESAVPIVMMLRGEEGKRVDVQYQLINGEGKQERFTLERGVGGLSKMADGNTAIIGRIIYKDRSEALEKLDRFLQHKFNMRPTTDRLESAIVIEEQNGNPQKAEQLRQKKTLLDSLLKFDPQNNTETKYKQAFPRLKRLPLSDIEPPQKNPNQNKKQAT